MKIHRGFRPLPESSPIALCSSYRGRVVLTEDPTKVTCNRCRSITGDLPATKGRVLRDGSPAPFCFIPQDCKGEIPVALTEEQRSFLLSLDPHCLTPGERRALRKGENVVVQIRED